MEDPVCIGPWRILGRLGAGGMGVVYRARRRDTGALAAVKTIRAADPAVVRTLGREIRALARLKHPGVVPILEDGEQDGVPWYAMELVDGPTLADVALAVDAPTRAGGAFADDATQADLADAADVAGDSTPADPVRVARVYARLAAALAWVHGEGVVHQDLKPSNVILRDGDRPVLVDFGLAGAFAGADGREALDLGAFGGTVAYLSPEHLRGEPVDARGDLYALGVMLFRALTGRAPFVGTASQVMEAHLATAPPHPRSLVSGIPERLAQLVLELLAKDPRDRIGHAGAVADRLAEWAGPDVVPDDWPPARPYLYRPALSGREDVQGWLHDQLRAGGVALLGGASGLGKTRMLVDLGRKAAAEGHLVLTGRAVAPDEPGSGALHALRGPLEQLAERHRDHPPRVFGDRGGILAPFAPGVPDSPPAPKLPATRSRIRLAEAVAETLREAARHEPVLLLLDDLHHADALTIAVLERVARGARTEPLAIVGTWRSDHADAAVTPLLDRAEVNRARLGPLDPHALAALVGDMLAERRPSERLLDFLEAHADGNPLFVSEYLKAAVDRGMLARDGTGRWALAEAARPDDLGLPRTIEDLLAQRVAALEPDLRAVAEMAAVLGSEVDPAVLAKAADLAETAVQDALHALGERQVLAEGHRFAHPALRDRLYERIGRFRRIGLHRAAWSALPAIPATSGARAHHAEHAGDHDAAAALWFEAGRYAVGRYDHAAAEAALRACIRLGAPEVALEARFHLAFDVLYVQGRLDEAAAETRQELAIARELGAHAVETRALRSLAGYALERGTWEEAHRGFVEALELDRSRGSARGIAFGAYNLAQALRGMGRHAEALPLLQEALGAARTVSSALREHHVVGSIAGCLHELGSLSEAEPLYEQGIRDAIAEGDLSTAAIFQGNLGNLCATTDRLAEADAHYRAAASTHRQLGYEAGEALVLGNQGELRLALGDAEGAATCARRAADLFAHVGNAVAEAKARVVLAHALHDLGRDAEAAVVLESMPPDGGDRGLAAGVAVARARAARAAGDLEAAAARLAETRAHLDTVGAGADDVRWLVETAHLQLARGERPALERLHQALARTPSGQRPYYESLARALKL